MQGGKRAQVLTQTFRIAVGNHFFDCVMGPLPHRNGARELAAAFRSEDQDAAAPIAGVELDPNETAAFERLQGRCQRGAVHRQQCGNGADGGRLWAIQRHKKRKLAVRQANRAQGLIKVACKGPGCALHVHAEAGVPNADGCLKWNRRFAGHRKNLVDINVFGNRISVTKQP